MDIRVQQAREHHHESVAADLLASRHRAERDRLMREVWDDDRKSWTYQALAKAIGVSKDLVAYTLKRGKPAPQGGRPVGRPRHDQHPAT